MCSASILLERHLPQILHQCSFCQLTQISALAITSSLARRSATVAALLLRRTTEFGTMDLADRLFSSLPFSHILFHNAMIRGYSYNGPYNSALILFDEIPHRNLTPNSYTYPYVLHSCTHLKNPMIGRKIHCMTVKAGFDCVPSVGSSLFKFYFKLENIAAARKIFDGLEVKNIGLWNIKISELVGIGDMLSARRLFDEMPDRDTVSWNTMLSAYARCMDVDSVAELFHRMPEKDVVSWTSMVRACASVGDIRAARRVFDEMPEKNVVSWNCMLSGYTQNGMFEQVLELFLRMERGGVVPDGYTFVSALSACAHLGALETGKQVHFALARRGIELGAEVGTALVEMYAKCGDVNRALRIFFEIAEKDVFCWNVMIKELGIDGRSEDAMKLFDAMKRGGVELNDFTFMSVLFACAHGRLVEEAHGVFTSMEIDFKIRPNVKHYSCFIDVLCCNGRLEEALQLVKGMPYVPDLTIWRTLLGSCKILHNIDLAEKVMEDVAQLKSINEELTPNHVIRS